MLVFRRAFLNLPDITGGYGDAMWRTFRKDVPHCSLRESDPSKLLMEKTDLSKCKSTKNLHKLLNTSTLKFFDGGVGETFFPKKFPPLIKNGTRLFKFYSSDNVFLRRVLTLKIKRQLYFFRRQTDEICPFPERSASCNRRVYGVKRHTIFL